MFARQCRVAGIALAVVFFVGAVCLLSPSPRACAAEAKESRLKRLLEARVAALKELVKWTNDRYDQGMTTMDEVESARRALLGAQLELCESSKERIALQERAVADAKTFEDYVAAKVRAGVLSAGAALGAKVYRLNAEIDLERATKE